MSDIRTQINVLMKRQFKIFIRDRSATVVRLLQVLFVAVLMGLIWWQLPKMNEIDNLQDLQTNLQDRFGALFLSTTFTSMNAITSAVQIFPEQRLVFEKERISRWYYSTPYILAKTIIDMPWCCIVTIPFCLICKYAINLHSRFEWYLFSIMLVALSCDSFGFLLGCIAPSRKIAAQLLPVTILPLMLFSGFFISIDTIPKWLRWLRWLDMYYYGVELLCIEEFGNVTNSYYPGVVDQFLTQYNMSTDNRWRNVYALIIIAVGLRLIGILYLVIKNGP